ncbi:MAG TPA: hypothetical protein VIK52_05560 [Opitutaceae bacterium]
MNPASASSSIDSSQLEEEHVLDAQGSTSDCHAGSAGPTACRICREEMSDLAVEMARWLAWQLDDHK